MNNLDVRRFLALIGGTWLLACSAWANDARNALDAEKVTEVSGRGVGMDAVKGFIEAEGGTIALRFTASETSQGFRPFVTEIALPEKHAVGDR